MTKQPAQPQDKYVLRLPDGLRERIKRAAQQNNRSMNAEIVDALQSRFPEVILFEVPIGEVMEIAEAYREASGATSESTPLNKAFLEFLWDICTRDEVDVPDVVRVAVRAKATQLGLIVSGENG